MPYVGVSTRSLALLTPSFVKYVDVLSLIQSILGSQSFQTQNGRDQLRSQLAGLLTAPATRDIRFPEETVFIRVFDSVIEPLWLSVLAATDTRNRIIEEQMVQGPTTPEVLNATKRVDDATVACRTALSKLRSGISDNLDTVCYDRAKFELELGSAWLQPGGAPGGGNPAGSGARTGTNT